MQPFTVRSLWVVGRMGNAHPLSWYRRGGMGRGTEPQRRSMILLKVEASNELSS